MNEKQQATKKWEHTPTAIAPLSCGRQNKGVETLDECA